MRMGEKGARHRVTKRRRVKERVVRGRGATGPQIRRKGCAWIFVKAPTEFLVTPLQIGPACLLFQGQFEETVRPCNAA